MVLSSIMGKIWSKIWRHCDGVPCDAAVSLQLVQRPIIQIVTGLNPCCMRVPLRYDSLGKSHLNCDAHVVRGVKVQNGGLHSNGSKQSPFEVSLAEMLHEAGQIG